MRRHAWWLAVPALVFLLAFSFFPLLSVFRYATWDWSGLSEPTSVGLANFRALLVDREFWRSLRVTFFFALLTLPSFLWLSRTIAIAIDGLKIERFVKALLFLPGLITVGGSTVAWYLLYNPDFGLMVELTYPLLSYLPCELELAGGRYLSLPCDGLALPWNSRAWAALVYVVLFTLWQSTGYGVLVVSAALKGIPESIREAARVDGASEAQVRRLIVNPLLRPTLLFLMVIGTVLSIQSYTAVFLLTRGGPFGSTRVLGYYLYETAFERFDVGYAAAMTIFVMLITLLIAGLQARVLQERQAHSS